MKKPDQEVARWISAAKQDGWRVVETKKTWQFFPVDGETRPISIYRGPSDWRSRKNDRAALKRAGLEI